MANNKDHQMMKNCVSEEALAMFDGTDCEHPLDSDIVVEIKKLCGTNGNNGLIRRDSDTCNDVYQLYMTSFSFLLRICDDTQEWGRANPNTVTLFLCFLQYIIVCSGTFTMLILAHKVYCQAGVFVKLSFKEDGYF